MVGLGWHSPDGFVGIVDISGRAAKFKCLDGNFHLSFYTVGNVECAYYLEESQST